MSTPLIMTAYDFSCCPTRSEIARGRNRQVGCQQEQHEKNVFFRLHEKAMSERPRPSLNDCLLGSIINDLPVPPPR
jgi:hypothetical protein